MSRTRRYPVLLLVLWSWLPLSAEIPLPDAVFYGTITRDGQLVGSGALVGVVTRDGGTILEVPGEFTSARGITHYVLRIPIETSGVTPLGSDGSAAREGDVFARLMLDGVEIAAPDRTLAPAALSRVDVGGTIEDQPLFIRGDCNSDGRPDVSDAIKTLLYLFDQGGSPDCEKACDANDDGGVDLADAVLVLDFLVAGGAPPRAPYPACGLDPSPDDLLCALGASGCGVAGGGGQVVAKGRGRREKSEPGQREAPAAAPELQAAPVLEGGRGLTGQARASNDVASLDDSTASRLSSGLEVTPARIRMGEIAGGGNVKTMTLRNRSSRAMRLSAASSSSAFSVSPSSFDLPPGGSFVVFVEGGLPASLPGDSGPSVPLPSSEGVDVFEGELHIGRVPTEFTAGVESPAVRLGSAAVADGTRGSIPLPVDVSGGTRRLVLDVTSADAFLEMRFEAARGVESNVLESRDARGLTLELKLPGLDSEEHAGRLVLVPRGPLAPGTYPVWMTRIETPGAPAGESPGGVHGEVRAQVPWLDVDGDGVARLETDVALLERFARSRSPLVPPDWPGGEPGGASVHDRIAARLGYFDVNGSGGLDDGDLALIDRALSGLPVTGRDESARLRNLYIPVLCADDTSDGFTIADVRRLLAHLFDDAELECPRRFDLDSDGDLSIRDAVLMVRSGSGRGGEEQ